MHLPIPGPRIRALASAWSAAQAAVLLGCCALALLARAAPPQDLPWMPLSLSEPVGMATGPKLASLASRPDTCSRLLAEAGVSATPAPDQDDGGFCRIRQGVRLQGGVDPMAPKGLVTRCPLAAAYVVWDRQVLQPAARAAYGASVRSVETFGTYACRRMYGRADQPPSEHARADAVDVSGFVLEDGRRVSVERGWRGRPEDQRFLRRVRDGGCRLFGVTLSPDFNKAHRNHLHLDMGGFHACR